MSEGTLPLNKLVLVDDDRLDQSIYARVVERSGMVKALEAFTNASEALDYLENLVEDMPSAFLVDINMPGFDGFEFIERAVELRHGLFKDIPYVMLTTSALPRDIQRARALDAVRGYLNKPLALEHLTWLSSLAQREQAGEPSFNLLQR